jgi:hypothetical protein
MEVEKIAANKKSYDLANIVANVQSGKNRQNISAKKNRRPKK